MGELADYLVKRMRNQQALHQLQHLVYLVTNLHNQLVPLLLQHFLVVNLMKILNHLKECLEVKLKLNNQTLLQIKPNQKIYLEVHSLQIKINKRL